MHRLTKRIALLAAAGTLSIGTLAACSNTTDSSTQGAAPTTTVSTSAPVSDLGEANEGDIMFAQMMIPHHQQAIEMADMALSKTSASATVKELATEIKDAQDPEIATMEKWLASWGAPSAAPTGMDHGTGMMTTEDMDSLMAAEGTDFDRMWLTMMVDHHEGAVTMAEDVLATTQNPDVTRLAESIIEAQKAEIATMEGLL